MAALQMNRSRWSLGLGVVAAVSFTTLAVADSPPASSSTTGLMTFPNVRVENAPLARQEPAKSASQAEGLIAAIDPETRQLRPVTADEARQLSARPTIQTEPRTARRTAAATVDESAVSDAGQVVFGRDNAVGVKLGEEDMVYQVARKTDEGLVTEEYSGADAAARAVSADAQRQEMQHGH